MGSTWVSYAQGGFFNQLKRMKTSLFSRALAALVLFFVSYSSWGQKTVTYGSQTSSGNFNWIAPAGVSQITTLQLWGSGGAGGGSTSTTAESGGGGASFRQYSNITIWIKST